MEIILTGLAAAFASLLTFFSGFGLGTLLTPVLILFFPPEIAIALTGIVHLLNNFFKISLVGRNINWRIGLRFGIPAIIGAFIGAAVLIRLPETAPLYTYTVGARTAEITTLKLIVAALMAIFALFEVVPFLKNVQFKEDKLYIGGLISGFFGGLSGNQGALRSAFLLRCRLTKESFIATGVLIACMIDLTRLSVYFNRLSSIPIRENLPMLITAILCAFAGAYLGSKALKKITLRFIQYMVTALIFLLSAALASGLI